MHVETTRFGMVEVDENRIIARHGLQMLRSTALPGLRALLECARLMDETLEGC